MTAAEQDRRLDALHDLVEAWGLDGAWRSRSACSIAVREGRAVIDDWFPARGDLHTMARAQAICATCPVTEECRSYADGRSGRAAEKMGVWGGLSTRKREDARFKLTGRGRTNVSTNGNGNGHRPPWARNLRTTAMVDDAELDRWGETIRPLVGTLAVLPDAWYVCWHLLEVAKRKHQLWAVSCTDHSFLLCPTCEQEHRTDGEMVHSSGCIGEECEQLGIGPVELVVLFDQWPIGAPSSEEVARASGGRMIKGRACTSHGAGRRWVWPEMMEGAPETEAS